MKWYGLIGAGCLSLMLAACSPPVRKAPDAQLMQAQVAREQALYKTPSWGIDARLGIANDKQVGSGSLMWLQKKQRLAIHIGVPVSGKSYRLCANQQRARLDGATRKPLFDASLDALMQRVFGWPLPTAAFKDWVRGLRARAMDADAQLFFADNGLPSLLEQGGWKVEYRQWDTEHKPYLPLKIYAKHGDDSVRLAVHAWLDEADVEADGALEACDQALL